MNGAHLHLVLNHFPIIGIIFSACALAFGMRTKDSGVQKVALLMIVLTGLTTIGAFATGEPAEHVIEHLPGVTEAAISAHEEAAELSAWMIWLTSAAALIVLFLSYTKKTVPRWALPLTLAGALVSVGLMARSNNLGGRLMHKEIAPAEAPQGHAD